MNGDLTPEPKSIPAWRMVLRSIIGIIVMCAIVFGCANRWDYWLGWLFVGVTMVYMAVGLILFRDRKDLIHERMKPGPGMKWWDKIFMALFVPCSYSVVIIASLDSGRYMWTAVMPWWGYMLGYVFYIGALCLLVWSMLTNNFFSSVVRIQSDRGQVVIQDGPYAFVRHPGYTAVSFLFTGISLCLGSFYGLIPATATIGLIVIRTFLEDATLQNELPGYKEYAQKVRWRLIRGIW